MRRANLRDASRRSPNYRSKRVLRLFVANVDRDAGKRCNDWPQRVFRLFGAYRRDVIPGSPNRRRRRVLRLFGAPFARISGRFRDARFARLQKRRGANERRFPGERQGNRRRRFRRLPRRLNRLRAKRFRRGENRRRATPTFSNALKRRRRDVNRPSARTRFIRFALHLLTLFMRRRVFQRSTSFRKRQTARKNPSKQLQ